MACQHRRMSEPHAALDVAPIISDAVVGWLEYAGPQRLSGITGRLVAEGLLDKALLRELELRECAGGQRAELDQEALAAFVLDELGYDDRVWATATTTTRDSRRPMR